MSTEMLHRMIFNDLTDLQWSAVNVTLLMLGSLPEERLRSLLNHHQRIALREGPSG